MTARRDTATPESITTSAPSSSDASRAGTRPAPGGATRHDARCLALQILFQWDFHGSTDFWLERFWAQQPAVPSVRAFATELVTGVQAHRAELDALIGASACNWTIDRMPVVDRNILRQSAYELLRVSDVPARVTVDEALRLAERFADDETRRFVNGVLDRILKHDPRLASKRLESAQGAGPRAASSAPRDDDVAPHGDPADD